MSNARLLIIQNDSGDPPARLGEWLEQAGLDMHLTRPYDGDELPETLDGYVGLVVLGGAMYATDDAAAPWLPAVRQLLRLAVEAEVPTLGVCLGAQLLAAANGGRVERNPEGPEFGASLVAKRSAAANDPLFASLPITPDVIQWHYDAVTVLPPEAVQLASSPGCDVQAFRLGRLAWGIQFHIETTPEIVRAWAADTAELAEYDLEPMLRRADAVHEDIAEVWAPFAASFADVVRDPDSVPAIRPIRVATAEPITDPAAIRAALAADMQAARQHPLPYPRRHD